MPRVKSRVPPTMFRWASIAGMYFSASAAKRLKLKKGAKAVAVIKATEVIVSTDLPADQG